MSFSVLMSVYIKEKPSFLKQAIESVLNQSILPSEIVLIKDGPLTLELEALIEAFSEKYSKIFKVISLKENVGLGKALARGVIECSHDIIARMDTDDICCQDRFRKQITYIKENPEIAVVGGWINEFKDSEDKISSIRKVPKLHLDIVRFQKKRNAMNHMTVVFRKNKVIEAGNYIDMPYFEDYYLWCRMMLMDMKFFNIQDVMVLARIGNDMIGRRQGFNYAKKEFNFL